MKKQSITLTHRYMILPINMNAKNSKILFYSGERLVWDFDGHIDSISPDFYTFLDIGHLQGQTLTLAAEGDIELNFEFTDKIPADAGANAQNRPMVHFSPNLGWLNDPNGLVKVGEIYHLFFQHNPVDSYWGNMTWGHAISSDLLHWKQIENALVPDKFGTVFSGSGITDKNNVSGLGTKENPPVLFYYTAAGGTSALSQGQPYTQCLAYSLDRGLTLKKYEHNPIIPHIAAENRDPKAVYCAELEAYVLALYLENDQYAIFTSKDLIHFEELQRLHLAGDRECPDIYPIAADDGERLWVFSGASDCYTVGRFENGRFKVLQESTEYAINKSASYSAQTYSDTEPRRIKIAWFRFLAQNSVFNCQMCIPAEVSLRRVKDKYRLCTLPVAEFESLRVSRETYSAGGGLKIPLEKSAYDISLTADRSEASTILSFFGHRFTLCPAENKLLAGDREIPLFYTDGKKLDLRIISDTLGYELYADGGLIYFANDEHADYNRNTLTLEADGKANPELTVCKLKSIR